MNKILEIKNLSKNYLSKEGIVNAIKDISFEVYEKDFINYYEFFIFNSRC